MEKLIATKIRYNYTWGRFRIYTDKVHYEGYVEYVNDVFILEYFSEKYIIEFKDKDVVKDLLKSLIEKYYFRSKDLSLNYKKLNNDLPFISLQIISVTPIEYLIKIKSAKTIFDYNINNYYYAHMENDLRSIKLFYSIGKGDVLKSIKEEVLNKYELLIGNLIDF